MINSTYVIVPMGELTQQMVDDCIQTSMDTLRKNLAETNCILKYQGAKPASISAYTDYTHEQMLIEVAKPEWEPSN